MSTLSAFNAEDRSYIAPLRNMYKEKIIMTKSPEFRCSHVNISLVQLSIRSETIDLYFLKQWTFQCSICLQLFIPFFLFK